MNMHLTIARTSANEMNHKPRLIGSRRGVLIAIAIAGVWAAYYAGLDPRELIPGEGGLKLAGEFFGAAFQPAYTYQQTPPDGAPPFLVKVMYAMITTVIFAAAAIGISIVLGLMLGFLASTSWWMGDPAFRGRSTRVIGPIAYSFVRTLIAGMRSVHELLWAVIFFAAMGISPVAAVIAIVIPYAGTLAKVFSEMIDEAPRDAAVSMRATGGTSVQAFCFGLLPLALPDLIAYALYRFECGLRSSAILGFFGILTVGYHLEDAFHYGQYREVWTYLYALFLLVALMDWWSGSVRRRLVV